MAGTHTVLLTLLPTVLILIVLAGVESAAVKDGKDSEAKAGASKQVFMPASDASNFFKRRGRRSPGTYEEYYAEQRLKMAANERRREHLEEQHDEHENYLEEERDEQYERTRERNEQWREFHYDGQYPRYPHHRRYV
ncbi:cartilage matrix-associated -like protein [Labeo rohita]|uniref:Unique cartilage matrix-associated protein n=1 Tax=Labeo rohita TaxID=84645 RepID=A0A498MUS2_LABRO|nr:upper zone of growth plate and cartilage matrix associated a isoform X1 [Labeo rohita]RXN25709.1 cartilage matrix-associated -like protein [Labeo rohita]RXN27472.1 cartilage matrix-associated -like protein [Labeo rohita]